LSENFLAYPLSTNDSAEHMDGIAEESRISLLEIDKTKEITSSAGREIADEVISGEAYLNSNYISCYQSSKTNPSGKGRIRTS